MRTRITIAAALFAAGCSGATKETPTTPAPTPAPAPTTEWIAPGGGQISLETSDGVTLEADYYPVEAEGAPGVVLLHMIPPGNDRTNWPVPFVRSLNEAGYAVIALDRRGAGGSEGVATEAYTGPNGKLDVDAAVAKLEADGYGDLALIGASNGTTSMIDYTVWAAGEGRPVPAALGFMTGGTYTEAQTEMSALPPVPAVFTFSTAERDWSEAQRPLDPGGATSWTFHEYPDGDHGTRMFEAAPAVADDLVAFLQAAVPAR
jgi:pimeloyl-ACP methyl ester carboxylesterase